MVDLNRLRNNAGWITLALGGYFFLIMLSSIVGLREARYEDSVLGFNSDTVTFVFYISTFVVCVMGQVAILFKSRTSELVALICISVLTVVNGILLLPVSSSSGIRLIAAPLMMLSFGWYRMQYTLTKKDVRFLHRTFDTEEGWSDSTATGSTGDQPDEE